MRGARGWHAGRESVAVTQRAEGMREEKDEIEGKRHRCTFPVRRVAALRFAVGRRAWAGGGPGRVGGGPNIAALRGHRYRPGCLKM